ncbi:MAG: glycerol-3-phosphate acyltransferase [Actinobacteria bacterium]|nr:glycerol-3-phosphate acyltransferase [Actinomycetota bacterium]
MSALQCVCVSAALLAVLIGYVIGSIPVADFVTRRAGAPNLRDVGDHNPGFWNSRSVLTRNQSLVVFVGDLLKGVVSVVAAQELSDDWRVWFLAAGAAMVGHAWPIFAKFSGGRSVLTWVGAAIVLSPVPAAFCVLMFVLFWAATRDFSHGVKIGVVLYPLAQWYADGAWQAAATGVLMTIIGLRFAMAVGFDSIRAAAPFARRRDDAAHDDQPRE